MMKWLWVLPWRILYLLRRRFSWNFGPKLLKLGKTLHGTPLNRCLSGVRVWKKIESVITLEKKNSACFRDFFYGVYPCSRFLQKFGPKFLKLGKSFIPLFVWHRWTPCLPGERGLMEEKHHSSIKNRKKNSRYFRENSSTCVRTVSLWSFGSKLLKSGTASRSLRDTAAPRRLPGIIKGGKYHNLTKEWKNFGFFREELPSWLQKVLAKVRSKPVKLDRTCHSLSDTAVSLV